MPARPADQTDRTQGKWPCPGEKQVSSGLSFVTYLILLYSGGRGEESRGEGGKISARSLKISSG